MAVFDICAYSALPAKRRRLAVTLAEFLLDDGISTSIKDAEIEWWMAEHPLTPADKAAAQQRAADARARARGGDAMNGANGYLQVMAKQAQRRPRGKDEFGKYKAKIDAYEAAKALGPVVAPALAWLANRGWFLHLDGALWQRDEREGADKLIAGRPELDMCSLGTSRAAIMAELRAEISMDPALFDADPDVCGLPNGRLLDLASGQVREPRMEQVVIDLVHCMVRAEHVTRCLPVMPMYHPRDGAVLFRDVLRHTVRHLTEPDAVTAWIRWWLRYALGGLLQRRIAAVSVRACRAPAKATVADTVAAMAGDYADNCVSGAAGRRWDASTGNGWHGWKVRAWCAATSCQGTAARGVPRTCLHW